MTYEKMMNLIKWASALGFKTAGDLSKFKSALDIQTNEELYESIQHYYQKYFAK